MHYNIDSINQKFKDNNYEMWGENESFTLSRLWKEENGEERIRLLVKENIVKESAVLTLIFFLIDNASIELTYENCPLVRILEDLERDGTMIYDDSDQIHYYCHDAYIDLIKTIVKLGGELDQNQLLAATFSGDKEEYLTFDYLLDNFTFDEEYVVKTAASIIYNDDIFSENKGQEAFKRLTEIGFDINTSFDEESEFHEIGTYLGLVFTKSTELFKQYLNEKPEQSTIDQFEWEYIIPESEMNEEHVELIAHMLKMGYQLPLEEIVSYIEDFDIATQIKALA